MRWGVAVIAGVVLFISIAGLILLVTGLGRNAQDLKADHTDARRVARGEQVYRQHCAACHGANLEGQPNWQTRKPDGRLPAPPHDETGHTWHHADETLFRITKKGVAAIVPNYESDMPTYGDVLADDDIWAVLAYIKSRWPPRIQDIQSDIDRRARQREPR